MNQERIIAAIDAYLNAKEPNDANAALTALVRVKYDLQGEMDSMAAKGAVTLPEGFVEFAMRAMKKAKQLREAGNAPTSLAYADPYGKAFWIVPGESDVDQLTTLAAAALLMAVEPATIEGQGKPI